MHPRLAARVALATLAVATLARGRTSTAAPPSDPLAEGWNRDAVRAHLRSRAGKGALRADWRQAIPARAQADVVASIPVPGTRPDASGILGAGDTLSISQDDDFSLSPAFGFEGRLAARSGPAGSSDFLAFRFTAGQLAHALPIDVTGADLGFDNRYGRTTWPLIGLKAEQPTAPLVPGGAYLAQVSAYALPSSALPAPSTAPGPDAFQRLAVTFPAPVTLSWNPVLDDGMWSDAFDRAIDENLDNPASDWVECDQAACGLNKRLTVKSMKAIKSLAGDALGVKFPAADVIARRPLTNLDAVLSVDYDVSAATAQSAGVFFRLESLDRFYFAEYRKATNQVLLSAMTSTGLVQLLPPVQPSGTPLSGNLKVEVKGAHPSVSIQVSIGPSVVLSHTDSTYTYAGVLSGIGNLGASTGESWDNFTVRRQPDLFVVVQLPAGEDAGLPAEWSPSSVGFGNVLASTDGTTYTAAVAGAGCVKAPNSFVQLSTASDTNLFQVESKLVELSIECSTCLDTRNLCAEDLSPLDRNLPVFEINRSLELNAGWWNERAPDLGSLRLEFQIWQGGCSNPGATFVTLQDVSVPLDAGQLTTTKAARHTLAAPGLSFTPTVAGDYCAWVYELYDKNGDGCFDGYEAAPGSPCPVGCTCVGNPDENASTGILTRDFKVVLPCTPQTGSEIVKTSLRAAEDPVNPLRTRLDWSVSGTSFRLFNIQMTRDKAELTDPEIRTTAATFARVLGGVPDTSTIQTLPDSSGGVLYFAVFQNDGCTTAWSLQDP